jgi:hypothetical protein
MAKIKYGDLSGGLKWAIVGGWISLISFGIGFLYGFIGVL